MPRKGAAKRRSRKSNSSRIAGSSGQQVNAETQTTTVAIPKQCQMFPSRYRCYGTTSVQATVGGVAGDSETFKMNGINQFGPQVNFTGSFGSNVPAGIAYLLSSGTASGASSPYGYATVISQEVTVRVLTNAGAGSVNFIPSMTAIMFSPNPTASGLSLTSIREQPYTAWVDVPAQTNMGAVIVKNSATCAQVAGVSPQVYRSDEDYWAGAVVDPTKLLYCHVLSRPLDNVSVLYTLLDIQFKTLYEFHTLNTFTSGAPA